MYRSNWFGFDEWKGQGLPISSTASSEAVKLYDAAVTQVCVFGFLKIVIQFFLLVHSLVRRSSVRWTKSNNNQAPRNRSEFW